jgi:hypothetical protein
MPLTSVTVISEPRGYNLAYLEIAQGALVWKTAIELFVVLAEYT